MCLRLIILIGFLLVSCQEKVDDQVGDSKETPFTHDTILKIIDEEDKAAVLSEIENGFKKTSKDELERLRNEVAQDPKNLSFTNHKGSLERVCTIGKNDKVLKELKVKGLLDVYTKMLDSDLRKLMDMSDEELSDIVKVNKEDVKKRVQERIDTLNANLELKESFSTLVNLLDSISQELGIDLGALEVDASLLSAQVQSDQIIDQDSITQLIEDLNLLWSRVDVDYQDLKSSLRELIAKVSEQSQPRDAQISKYKKMILSLELDNYKDLNSARVLKVELKGRIISFILSVEDIDADLELYEKLFKDSLIKISELCS